MDSERLLEGRLDEIEATLRSLVERVGELEAELARGSDARVTEARAPQVAPPPPPPTPTAPVQPPPRPTPPPPAASSGGWARPEAAAPASPPPPPPRPRAPSAPPPPPRPPSRTLAELARDWDLMGARGFAIAGGAVMALGIGLFFVLAANRGWIDDRGRVALGATASVLVFAAGLVLRSRYGQYWSALAAVAAGIAGGYATLAAASARYDLVPDALALPAAGVIAAIGTAVAIRWRSQLIAAIGLLGAALAPALQALDTEMTWESAAFAVVVLVAVGAVTVARSWQALLIAASVIVGMQVEWLALDTAPDTATGTIGVAAAFVLTLLGIAIARQVVATAKEVDPVALSYTLASFGATLLLGIQLFDGKSDRGIAFLVAAGLWALCFAGLSWRRLPDLALAVGASALALGAVGTADLLSDASLTIAWAAEAVVLAFLARQFRDARLQALSIVYAALAAVSTLATDSRLDFLFEESADHLAGALPMAAAAVAWLACGVLLPRGYRERTEAGLLAFVGELRKGFIAYRAALREAFVFTGLALATLSVAFVCLWASWDWGHVAATCVAALVGTVLLGAAGRIRSDGLAAGASVWLSVVLAEALVFDVTALSDEQGLTTHSLGGYSVIAAAAGLLAGAYANRLWSPSSTGRDAAFGTGAALAAATAAFGIVVVSEGGTARGIGFAAAAVVYALMSAAVFSRPAFRDVSTVLWSLALLLLIGAELFLVSDPTARAVALSATALAVGALSVPLSEVRLWIAGSVLAVVTTGVVILAQVQPWRDADELDRILAVGLAMCVVATVALAALRFREEPWRDAATVLWGTGLLALLAAERVLLGGWEATTLAVALTGGGLCLLSTPLRELRLWSAGLLVSATATFATLASFTPPENLLRASASPAESVWVLAGCILALVGVAVTAPVAQYRTAVGVVAGALTLYATSLAILELAEIVSGASVETDFERGHTAVSALWALVGLGLLVAGLLRGSAAIRYGGLALFGLTLAKIFLYDLAELSSIARAFSFILVGGLLLVGGFFLQRLSDRMAPRSAD